MTGPDTRSQSKKRKACEEQPKRGDPNVYHGVRLESCLCNSPDCKGLVRRWIDLNDNIRCGYLRLPLHHVAKTSFARYKNHVRDLAYHHLISHGSFAPRTSSQVYQFVAYHHYHPSMLQGNNQGPPETVDGKFARDIGRMTNRDRVEGNKQDMYHAVPNYSLLDVKCDLQNAEAHATLQAAMVTPGSSMMGIIAFIHDENRKCMLWFTAGMILDGDSICKLCCSFEHHFLFGMCCLVRLLMRVAWSLTRLPFLTSLH